MTGWQPFVEDALGTQQRDGFPDGTFKWWLFFKKWLNIGLFSLEL